jgi:putative ABC transport system permease protein
MKIKDIFTLALTNIRHRQLRSWLTILGIVIGVASIVSLIGVSLGMSEQISSRLNTLGANMITVSPGGQRAVRAEGFGAGGGPPGGGFGGSEGQSVITFREADVLRTLPGVYRLDARIQKRETVQYRDKNSSLTVIGTEPESFKDTVGVNISYGRYLNNNDGYSVVLGFNVANATFNDFDILNKQVKIDGVPFRVVGILAQSGSSFGGTDSDVFIPQTTAKSLFNSTTDASQLVIVTSPGHDTDAVATEIENELLDLHGLTKDKEDFTVTTATTMQSAVSSVTDTLSLFLGGIASISLLVGGIGVANTMFMSVLEQTKDIGVLKSLGAKNRDIVYLFLCEAATIGLIGGFLGILLSFGVSFILTLAGMPSVLSAELVLGGLFFSAMIGIVAGISPARSAASIPPVEALKYE